MRASWKPLIVGGAWNPELRKLAREASGVYVVRRIADRVVLYVGMSESGVMWKTLQRHFQAWKTLPDLFWSHDGKALVRGRESFQHARPELLEAALFITSTGKRTKRDPDRAARDLEQSMIRRYRPIVNVDPGHAWDERQGAPVSRSRAPRGGSVAASRDEDVPEEDAPEESDAAEPEVYEDTSEDGDDPFSVRNPSNPPAKAPKLDINVPVERRADMRTPDLFTGRTKLEESKAPRADWKGRAEALARELDECKAAPRVSPEEWAQLRAMQDTAREVSADLEDVRERFDLPPPPPVVRPEGFGETNARGQARMFNPAPRRRRNPPIPEIPASSIVRYLRIRPNAPISVVSYDGDRSFMLKEDGRHIARLIPSRDLAEWMRESLSAAKLDARLHNKLTELVAAPPGDGTEFGEWSLGGVYSNNEAEILRGRFVTDSNGDQFEQPEVAAWLESPALAQVVGALVEQGRKLRASFAASKASEARARAVGATHGLRPGMRVHWTTERGSSREAEHFGTVEALAPNDGAIILEDGRRKPGQKSVRDVSPPFRHDLNVRHSDVRQIAPSDDPRHKPAKAPRAPKATKRPTFAAKRAELLEALRSRGWSVEANLKTPHATNRDGDRLWFRSQAVYLGHKSSGERAARSLVSDMREVSADDVERLAQGEVTPAMPAPPPRAPWQEIGVNRPHEMFPRGAIDFVAYVDRAPSHALAVDDSPIGPTHLYVETAKGKGWIAEKPARGRWPARYVVTSAGSYALGTFDSDDRGFRDDARAAKEAARRARVEREAAEAAAAAAKRAEEDAARAAEAAAAKPKGYGVEERGKGRTGRGAGQLRMFNPPREASAAKPSGALVMLGALTEIVVESATGSRSAWRWALRSAPVLAYDSRGRLFVVYPSRKAGKATDAARKSYARTHWGKAGKGDEMDGSIVVGKARVLGRGISVTYTTEKGGDVAPVDYVHEWGEGHEGRLTWTPPLVVVDGSAAQKVAFSGGTYRVTERGIVG